MSRDPMFTLSDIRNAAEDFVETLQDLAEGRLTDSGAGALADALTDAGIAVLRDPTATFEVVRR